MSHSKLAIDGGNPSLNLHELEWPQTSQKIKAAIEAVLEDGSWGKYDSYSTNELMEELGNHFQSEHVTLCSSGTIGVELALRGCGVQPDSEVILAGYDFPGNFRAIEAIGARPVLVDVVPGGWVMSASTIEEALSEQTKAVLVSHLHGQIANVPEIKLQLDSWNQQAAEPVYLVEDTCQSPGGSLDGRPLGSLADVGVLSFGGSKLLSAGRGGAVLTNDPKIHQRAKIFANRGNDAFPLSQLQAATLRPQLEELTEFTRTRLEHATELIRLLSDHRDVSLLEQVVSQSSGRSDAALPAFYKFPWLLKDRTPGWTRSEFIAALWAEGIPVGEGFRGFLRRSPRRCRKVGTLVHSQVAAQQTVLLSHPPLLEPSTTIELLAQTIIKVLDHAR